MRNMTAERKRQVVFLCISVLALFFLTLLFVVRYRAVNAGLKKVDYQSAAYGEAYELAGISYEVQEPSYRKEYDKDYQMEVYRYRVPITITNRGKGEISIYDIISNFCLLSGGSVWYGNIKECEKDVLDAEDALSADLYIDVIPEDGMEQSVYEKAELYQVVKKGKKTYKVEYQ